MNTQKLVLYKLCNLREFIRETTERYGEEFGTKMIGFTTEDALFIGEPYRRREAYAITVMPLLRGEGKTVSDDFIAFYFTALFLDKFTVHADIWRNYFVEWRTVEIKGKSSNA